MEGEEEREGFVEIVESPGVVYSDAFQCICEHRFGMENIPNPRCTANHLPLMTYVVTREGRVVYGKGPITIDAPWDVMPFPLGPVPSLAHLPPARHVGPEEYAESQRPHSIPNIIAKALAKHEYDAIWAAFADTKETP